MFQPPMDWKPWLAYVTGSVDAELLRRNEYVAAENQILCRQIKRRLLLNDDERSRLAEIGKRLGRKALSEVAMIVKLDTILGWHRKLIARKFTPRPGRKSAGRPRVDAQIEELILRMARKNRTWG